MNDNAADSSPPPDPAPGLRERLESKSSGAPASRTPDGTGARFPDLEDMFGRVSEATDPLFNVGNAGAAFANVGGELQGFKAVTDTAAQRLAAFEAIKIPDFSPPTFPRFEIPPDPNWETARYARQQVEQLAEWTAAMEEQREENERKEAERDEREQRALKVAEDSLAEARKSRIITAWSVAVALISLIVAVITVVVA